MRSFKVTLSSLTLLLLLLLCAPARGQDSPAASQYAVGSCPQGSVACVQSVNGSVEDFADNAGQGTDAVNDAFDRQTASASVSASSAASASAGSALTVDKAEVGTAGGISESGSPGTDSSGSGSVAAGDPEAAGVASEEGLDSITELPETGGAHPALPIAGALLVAAGLMIRRITAP